MKPERTFTQAELEKILKARLRQAKAEPHGLALVVADLVERVQRLEARGDRP